MSIETSREYMIHYFEVDLNKKLRLSNLIGLFVDCGLYQSNKLSHGLKEIEERNLTWIVYNFDIDIVKLPLLDEKITMKTKAIGFEKFYGYRQFLVFNENDELIITCKGIYILIDLNLRKPVMVTDDIVKMFGITEEENKKLKRLRLKRPDNIECHKEFNVRYEDIDTNNHVNSARYVTWVIETIPLDILNNYEVVKFIITYSKEVMLGEDIEVFTEIINDNNSVEGIHRIIDKNNQELNLSRTVWKKIDTL